MVENIIPDEKAPELTMEYVLSKINYILKDVDHIHEAMNSISSLEVGKIPDAGMSDKAKSSAIVQIVKERETTNQQLLKLLEKMYDDLKPKKPATITDLESLLNSDKVMNACIEAIKKSDIDSDTAGETIDMLYNHYEMTRRYIAEKLIALM